MYFALFEAFGLGQTPGKRLLKLRRQCEDGSRLTTYHTFLRSIVFFAWPLSVGMLMELFKTLFSFAVGEYRLFFSTTAFASLAIPISIFVGKGVSSIPDRLAGTRISYDNIYYQTPRLLISKTIIITAIISILSIPFAKQILGIFSSVLSNSSAVEHPTEIEKYAREDTGIYMGYALDEYDLSKYMDNVGQYVIEPTKIIVVEYDSSKHKFIFLNSPIFLDPSYIPSKKIELSYYGVSITQTTLDGFLSYTFQRKVLEIVYTYLKTIPFAEGSNIVVVQNFSYEVDIYLIRIEVVRKQIVFMTYAEGQLVPTSQIIEPDSYLSLNLYLNI